MTKRRAEGVIYHDSPHKRLCFQSLRNETALPDIRVVRDAGGSSLLSFLSNHCRKRNHVDAGETQEFSRPRKRSLKSKTNGTVLTDNVDNSGRFRDVGMQQVAPKKRPREETQLHEADHIPNGTAKADEDLISFNTFQFWRAPLPELDMSLLQNDVSPDPMATKNCESMKNSESMET